MSDYPCRAWWEPILFSPRYVIYDHPRDYPGEFVVRRWELGKPRELLGSANTLQGARKLLPPGLVNLGRYEQDDPFIVEVWV